MKMTERRALWRGKRVDNGEWMTGYYVGKLGCDDRHTICDIDCLVGVRVEIDPATLGQCTGLKDKEGGLIFEGDIIKAKKGDLYRVYGMMRVLFLRFIILKDFGRTIFKLKMRYALKFSEMSTTTQSC